MNKKQYKKLCKTRAAEYAKGRNPNTPRINVYVCEYGHRTVTIDRADGVTPALIVCKKEKQFSRLASNSKKDKTKPPENKSAIKTNAAAHECGELAGSKLYRVIQTLNPTFEFYRPDYAEYKKITYEPLKNHVEKGGLLLREIEPETGQKDN